ncbi:MAG: hypothetical protein DI556_13390 [Rhodovulum sulfidophilum]|uniref:Peptidase S26 domain-containing protein n=1 Tax=Rhodovulum sulfidophilum TaxID=35806 RepID=A0A2W5Q236_RHOSU|nr:MAG: hypothetical protein DI556_13390 [Rhodovulum sulfidophilum]
MRALAKFHPEGRRLTSGYLLRLGVTIGVVAAGSLYISARYTFAVDGQWFRCMAEKYFVIDRWRPKDPSEIRPLDVLAFEMSDRQAYAALDWRAGDGMAKRVLATIPGTRIEVGLDGVRFVEPGGRSWEFGLGLEAAATLGRAPEEFARVVVLEPGQLWMMGDMKYSVDSRYYGPIDVAQVTGKVVASW